MIDQDFTAAVKKDYFPYLTQGRDLAVNSLDLFAIAGRELLHVSPDAAIPDGLTLADGDEFELSLSADDSVLIRDAATQAFAVLRYSLA
jgi:hypothetical protein